MTAEMVFKFYRAFKFYYQGKYDLVKYKGRPMKCPPLINQPDRRFFHRISQKLDDAQIQALFTYHFFFTPNMYVADMVTPNAFSAALTFSARAENGRTLLEHDLYALRKKLDDVDLDEWLYGEWLGDQRAAMPECLQMLVNKELPLDIAAILLLVPRVTQGYHWSAWMLQTSGNTGLGPAEWVERLKKADMLIKAQRPGWRALAWELSESFWGETGRLDLSPRMKTTLPALEI